MSDTRIRPITDDDVGGFLRLYRSHLGTLASELWDADWLRWKYERNPNVRETAVMVAERDDRIVGGIGFMPIEMSFRGRSFLGVQPVDIVVHPDYRNPMVFTELVERGLLRFGTDDPWLAFGQPREESIDAWTRLRRWKRVRAVPRSWRIHRIRAFVRDMLEDRSLAALAPLSQPFLSASRRITDARYLPTETDSTVTEHRKPPIRRMADIYERLKPEALHVVRDRAFYRWRVADVPHADYRTYLAERNGTLVGSLTTSRWRSQSAVRIVDHVPLSPSGPGEVGILRDLVATAIRSHADAGGIRAPLCLPTEIRTRLGFDQTRHIAALLERAPALDRLTDSLPSWEMHFAGRITDDAEFPVDARSSVLDWDSWAFTGIEIDTD